VAARSHPALEPMILGVVRGSPDASACRLPHGRRRQFAADQLVMMLAELEAEQTRLQQQLLAAPPSAVRLMPNLGQAYRHTLARLVETLAGAEGGEALHPARGLIDRVVIHPAPLRTPPGDHGGGEVRGDVDDGAARAFSGSGRHNCPGCEGGG